MTETHGHARAQRNVHLHDHGLSAAHDAETVDGLSVVCAGHLYHDLSASHAEYLGCPGHRRDPSVMPVMHIAEHSTPH